MLYLAEPPFVKISKSFVFLWCQLSSNKSTRNSIWINNSYFREEIWVSLDEAYYFCGNESLQSEICILLKRDMLINESYHISSFWSLREFTDKLLFLWHLLDRKLPKMGKLKQSLEVPILTCQLHVSQGEICVSAHVGNLAFEPHRKNDISSYFSPRSVIQTAKCSLLDEKIVYQSSYGALLTLSYMYFLLQGKVLCFGSRVGKSLARCLLSKAFRRPCRKNYISGYIWHKSFIQTVKCSFFNQIIVYQSFYGALLTFSYFLLQGKVMCFGTRRRDVSSEDLVEKVISPVLFDRNRSFKW